MSLKPLKPVMMVLFVVVRYDGSVMSLWQGVVLVGVMVSNGLVQADSLDEVKAAWRAEIQEKAKSYLERRTQLTQGYSRICSEEEAAARRSGHRLAKLFWESERLRLEEGGVPSLSLKQVPPKAAEIRSKWLGSLGEMDQAYVALVAKRAEELDRTLEKLEIALGEDEAQAAALREVLWTRITLSRDPDYAMQIARGTEEDYGYVVSGDLALSSRGAEEFVEDKKGGAIDGIKNRAGSMSRFKWPGALEVTLQTAFRVDRIRFQLYHFLFSDAERYFRYRLKVSADGYNWETVVDRSAEGEWRGWQDIRFDPRPVKAIRLEGTYNSKSPWWTITEVEVFCPLSDAAP